MALLEDPTIQRILDEVNKAATGGILGAAGNYVSKPTETMAAFDSALPSSQHNFVGQEQAPLFYPTPDMFGMNSMKDFDHNMDLNPLPPVAPMAKSTSFDLYSSGYYNTMPSSFLAPYENFNGMTQLNVKHQFINNEPMRSRSNISSMNNDMLLEHHRHHDQEYSTLPLATVPNLGLNIRTTSQSDPIASNSINSSEAQLTSEKMPMDVKEGSTSTMNLLSDKADTNSMKLNSHSNNDTDQDNYNSQGQIFYDPNPQIIQRKGSHSVTYKQNIIVRYLQPPPIPNAGPLIIKEVRPPQPSPLPPLVIKQRPTPPKTPPPLVIREKPPPLPSTVATKVITRQLPPEPAPPRAVIIERLPPLPPKPRDIIIERWLPYEILNRKRKVIVQRAQKPNKEHPPPKNIIITYEPVHAKIVRNFQKQNITREDPQAYLKRFGTQLFDSNIVIQKARAAGVVEDLNPPLTTSVPVIANNNHISADFQLLEHENQQENDNLGNHEKMQDKDVPIIEQHEEGNIQESATPNVQADENDQEEDVLVEENVTPFYMNTGEDLEQTLNRLGIDMAQHRRR